MIISVSRRTDIPSYYGEWFINRIKEGYVLVRNPINPRRISKIKLSTDVVDCFVFWTKNAKPFTRYLSFLDNLGYNYYFQYTVTPYDENIEGKLCNQTKKINNFLELSQLVGKERIVWRYDPIILDLVNLTIDYHKEKFEELCEKLAPHCHHVIISFIDLYRKINSPTLNAIMPEDMLKLASAIGKISYKYGIKVKTCCEVIDLSQFGIEHGACVNQEIVENICNETIILKNNVGQRKHCLCKESIDIGAYNTCLHDCIYCYATDKRKVEKQINLYDKDSPLLCSKLLPEDIIYEKEIKSCKSGQIKFM